MPPTKLNTPASDTFNPHAEINPRCNNCLMFSKKETSFYLDLFERVISRDCPTAALNIVYQHCMEIVSQSINKHSHEKESTNSNIAIFDQHIQTDPSYSVAKVFIGFLLFTELENFSDLITTICKQKPRHASRKIDLAILELLLSSNGLHRHSIVDRPLTFGDAPIMQAVRTHDYDVIRLLLRHSADVTQGWLQFENPLEIALFSPSERYVSDAEIESIERCVGLLLMAMPRVNLPHMDELKSASYHPLHAEWKRVVVEGMALAWGSDSSVASLKHLSRCTLRSSLSVSHRLVSNVGALPIPTCLKRYVLLDDALPIR